MRQESRNSQVVADQWSSLNGSYCSPPYQVERRIQVSTIPLVHKQAIQIASAFERLVVPSQLFRAIGYETLAFTHTWGKAHSDLEFSARRHPHCCLLPLNLPDFENNRPHPILVRQAYSELDVPAVPGGHEFMGC